MRVYLAGPINGCTDEEAKGWRELVKASLPHLQFLDPMDRDYRGKEEEHASLIVEQDLAGIEASDVVLVNAIRPTWGTAMETWQAGLWGKRVVVIAAEPVSPWLRFVALDLVPDIEAAIRLLTRFTPKSIRSDD